MFKAYFTEWQLQFSPQAKAKAELKRALTQYMQNINWLMVLVLLLLQLSVIGSELHECKTWNSARNMFLIIKILSNAIYASTKVHVMLRLLLGGAC